MLMDWVARASEITCCSASHRTSVPTSHAASKYISVHDSRKNIPGQPRLRVCKSSVGLCLCTPMGGNKLPVSYF